MRGHKVGGMLTAVDYNNLTQCETLDDIKLNLVRFFALLRSRSVDRSPAGAFFFCSARAPR